MVYKGYENKDDLIKYLESGIVPNVILSDGKDGYEIEYQENDVNLASTKPEELSKALHAGQIPNAYEDVIEKTEVKDVRKLVADEPSEAKTIDSIYGSEEKMLERAKEGYFVRKLEKHFVFCPAGEILRQKCIKQNGTIRYANKKPANIVRIGINATRARMNGRELTSQKISLKNHIRID